MRVQKSLVSVILPSYNRAHFIAQAITSVLNQTYQNIELIIVDDGSTDNTQDVIATFDDERLRYIKLPKNIGRSFARNQGIRAAQGEFLAFLDSDDYFLPFKIEFQVNFLYANHDVQMVYTGAACISDIAEPIKYFYHAPLSGYLYNEIAFFKPLTIILPTVMLRHKILTKIGSFDEKMNRFEDVDFWRRISKKFKIGAINEITCHIRSHEGNHVKSFPMKSFEDAIDYYAQKILTEDIDVDPIIIQAGLRRLYGHYATGLARVSGSNAIIKRLESKARQMFQPLVSIVIPVYNGENFLAQAVNSALGQTYKNIEIIIVNDGSSDDGATERIALAYRDHVRYFSKPNGGCSSALNYGVRQARGKYISWLSHDDLMVPTKIEKQVAFLAQQANPDKTVVYGDYSIFYGKSPNKFYESAVNFPEVEPQNFRYFLTTQNILHGCTLLIPKQAIIKHGMFDEKLKTVLDFDLWFKLAKTESFLFLPGVVVHARSHPEQDSKRKLDLFMKEANELLAYFAEELSDLEVKRGSNKPRVEGYYMIATSFKRRNFHDAALHVLRLVEKYATEAIKLDGNLTPEGDEVLKSLFLINRTMVMQDKHEPMMSDAKIIRGFGSYIVKFSFRILTGKPFIRKLAILCFTKLPARAQSYLVRILQRYKI
jgi:glycosyltransferase involved in cell wall biosynthesis